MRVLGELGKLLKSFTPYYYDLTTNVPTAISPKPAYYFGKIKEEQAFYVFETLSKGQTQTKDSVRLQILYKHKEKQSGMGMIEARNVIEDLKNYLEENSFSYDSSYLYVGNKDEYYTYSLNLTTNEIN